MTIKIFSPNSKDVKAYNLGETVDVQINSSAIIPILADKIYKDPLSAVRELYANEVTACKKSLVLDPSCNPRIEIRFNTDNRELSIKGIDSLGIDSETFYKILAIMGNSGNNKGEQAGYFGLGFYSYVKLSERCILVSNSRESKEKYAYIGKSSISFEKMPEGSFEHLDQFGFNIILTVKDEISESDITSKIQDLVKLSGIKTDYYINDVLRPLQQFKTLLDYFKDTYSAYFNNDYPTSSLIYRHEETEDYEIITARISISSYVNEMSRMQEVRLLNTPIHINDRNINSHYNHGHSYIINLKNERNFKPKPDREDLKLDSENKVVEIINAHEIIIGTKKYNNISEWFDDKEKIFFTDSEGLCVYGKTIHTGSVSNKQRMTSHLRDYGISRKPAEFLVSKTLRKALFHELYINSNIFCFATTDQDDYDILIKFGFKDMNEYLGKKNIKYKKPVSTKRYVFHFKYSEKSETISDDVIVFRTSDLINERRYLDYLDTRKICMIVDNASYEGKTYTLDEIPAIIKDHIFLSNHGFKTGEQILKKGFIKVGERMENKIKFESETSDLIISEFLKQEQISWIIQENEDIEVKLLQLYLRSKGFSKKPYSNDYIKTYLNENIIDNDVKYLYEKIYGLNMETFRAIMRLNKKCQS